MIISNTSNAIRNSNTALAVFIQGAIKNKLDTARIARSGYAMLEAGCSRESAFPGLVLADYLIQYQQGDGGWADVEETIWSLGYLSNFGTVYRQQIQLGKKWLRSIRQNSGVWGRTNRDQPRIPITALVTRIVPDVADRRTSIWLANEWKADLNRTTPLTYKGAFYLLGQCGETTNVDERLNKRTIKYLIQEQNDDGGFAPWKGHPIGSDPWTTGIVLWGLASSGKLAPKTTIERAIQWLETSQLPNGLWPYHYLDDGTAMALIGLSGALAVLRN